jgi:phage terminase large subunit-like protein
MHMTGNYPDWWKGKRFDKPVLVWTGSPTNETSRSIVQKQLLGSTDNIGLGTGSIPRDRIVGKPKMRQAGVGDVVDSFRVRHKTGGISTAELKTYEQGWRKWQGTEPDVVWLDEEPDITSDQRRIYSEALTRLLTSHGVMMVTFTPLLGVTDLVSHYQTGGRGVSVVTASWEDAPHLLKDERDRLADSYPDYELDARTKGIPMLGEGRVFKVREETIRCKPFEIPAHYSRIAGIDFGMDHPTAGAWLAHDRDADIVYLNDCYRMDGRDSLYHAKAFISRGQWIPVSWPHDGANRERGSGQSLKNIYRGHGLRLLSRSACYSNDKRGAQPKWPIIETMQERMLTGRFKVFNTCNEWLEEFRSYHVKDGKLTVRKDDALKASFYALMMLRYASSRTMSNIQSSSPPPVFSMRI